MMPMDDLRTALLLTQEAEQRLMLLELDERAFQRSLQTAPWREERRESSLSCKSPDMPEGLCSPMHSGAAS
jgi:hypothetical protein